MKKQDLLVFSFLPSAFGIVLMLVMPFLPVGLGVLIGAQIALVLVLLLSWWALGRWSAGQDRTPWNSFALLQWWGVMNLVFSFLSGVPVLQNLAQAYAGSIGFFFLPLVDFENSVFYLPMQVFLLLLLSSVMFLLGFRTVQNRRNSL